MKRNEGLKNLFWKVMENSKLLGHRYFHSIDLSKSLKLFDYVMTGIQVGSSSIADFSLYFGYVVQIRKGAGAYGSDLVILRHPNGQLFQHHNQVFYVLSDSLLQEVKAFFNDDVKPENEKLEEGFDCGNKDTLAVGFIIDDKVKIPYTATRPQIKITVKDSENRDVISEVVV